jgi:septum formation protein
MSTSLSLILASASPRRRELLARLGAPFEVFVPQDVDEEAVTGPARDVATTLARQKAEAALRELMASRPTAQRRWIVLGADTVVAADEGAGEVVLGKPRDAAHAREILRLLSGRTHRVWTGVAVARSGQATRVEAERTDVAFKPLCDEVIERYLATGDHEGKAGAYGIQSDGCALVSGFRGCYYNVVGLPLALAARMLEDVVPLFRCDCFRHPLQRDSATAFPRRCAMGPSPP